MFTNRLCFFENKLGNYYLWIVGGVVLNIRKYILSICCISIIGCHGVTEPCGVDKTDFLFSVDKLVEAAAYESQSDAPDFVKLDHQMQALKEKCLSKWEEQLTLKEQLHVGRQLVSYENHKLSAKKRIELHIK